MARPTTTARRFYKRPFMSIYYAGTSRNEAPAAFGAAKTLDNAKKASGGRMVVEQYSMVRIVDKDLGVVVLTLRRTANGITMHFGRAGGE